ncbi:Facilitated trehalose transporter Tret1-2 [Portunus trituberculatus]|uniref:Facilitated trehalose transporter Tret1-2 n=1 Tax=Portunus trituberculatus TaxID=210409 RepID=A0A5B7FQV3_PORTR|nr:Facilitated trehalose transporter Tret1-2 [Portunus trituberculatus]
MCLNLLSALSTSYMVETADKNSRGWQNGILYVCKSVGLLVPAIATMAGLNWRQTGTLCCVLSLVPIPSLLLLPDSPRWLMTRGRNTDVQKSLKYFRGDNCEIESEYSSIAAQAVMEGPGNICHQTSMLFRAPTRHTMGLLLMMMLIIYFGGSQLVITYLVPILQLTKTSIDPYQISILCFMSRILSAILFVCLTHRLKRKPLIIAGFISTSLSYGMIGLYFILERFEVSGISWMPIAAILIILFSDGCAFPGYHTMEGELLPLSCRTTGILALKCAGGISGVVNNMTYEEMIVALGKDATFLFYGALGAICPFVVMFRFQETHGVALEKLTNNTGQERRTDP